MELIISAPSRINFLKVILFNDCLILYNINLIKVYILFFLSLELIIFKYFINRKNDC